MDVKSLGVIFLLGVSFLIVGYENVSANESNQDFMTSDEMIGRLTADQLKEGTPPIADDEKNDATISSNSSDENQNVTKFGMMYSGGVMINDLIRNGNFNNPIIEQQLKGFPIMDYGTANELPTGIVVHETANPNSSIQGEIDYMTAHYDSAFVHAFVDSSRIIQIHDTSYKSWGCGPIGNNYFIQIELVESSNKNDFLKSVNNDAYYIAYLLRKYRIAPKLAIANNGSGSIWSHADVSRYLGGTNHTDPTGYFSKYGYDMYQFYNLILEKYNAMAENPLYIAKSKSINKVVRFNGSLYNMETYIPGLAGANQYDYTNNHVGETAKVGAEYTLTNGEHYYNFEINGHWGWANKKSFVNVPTVVKKEPVFKSVKFNSGMYSMTTYPNGTAEFETYDYTSVHKGKIASVCAKYTLSDGTAYYNFNLDGRWGWADINAFENLPTVIKKENISKPVKFNGGMYDITVNPADTLGSFSIDSTGKHSNSLVCATAKYTLSNGLSYYNFNLKGIWGWADTRAFIEFPTIQTVSNISKLITFNGGMYRFTNTPDGLYGAQMYNLTSNFTSKTVFTTAQYTLSNGESYYNFNLDGRWGWANTKSFI